MQEIRGWKCAMLEVCYAGNHWWAQNQSLLRWVVICNLLSAEVLFDYAFPESLCQSLFSKARHDYFCLQKELANRSIEVFFLY